METAFLVAVRGPFFYSFLAMVISNWYVTYLFIDYTSVWHVAIFPL